MKARAVVFPKADQFEFRELELEPMGPRDVLVRTLVTAISPGTERWILRGKHLGTQFPCVPGYHRIGIVEKAGKDVASLQEGDVVYGSSSRWQEKEVKCLFGAHVSYSVGDESAYRFYTHEMPGRFELETVAFTILVGVAHRGIRFLQPQPAKKMVIIGAGIIGICAAQLAARSETVPVILDVDQERIDFVKKLGFNVLNSGDASLDKKLKEIAPDGFDFLYDTVGHAPTTDKMVRLMRRQGMMMMQAQYFDKEKCAVDLDQIKIRELTVKTTCGIDDLDWDETAALIKRRALKVAPLITHRFDAKDALKGYRLLHTGKPFNLGIVFHWDKRVK